MGSLDALMATAASGLKKPRLPGQAENPLAPARRCHPAFRWRGGQNVALVRRRRGRRAAGEDGCSS